MDIIYVYLALYILCLLVLLATAINHKQNNDLQKANSFSIVIIIECAILAITDFLSICIHNKVITTTIEVHYLVNSLYMITSGILSVGWLFFTKLRFQGELYKSKLKMFIISIPFFVLLYFSLSAYVDHLLFYIDDDNNYVRGILIWIQFISSFFYLVHAFCIQLRYVLSCDDLYEKRSNIIIMILSLIPLIGIVLQLVFPKFPIVIPSICFIIFTMSQLFISFQINFDDLTGLYVRRIAFIKISKLLTKHNLEEKNYYLIVSDINNFKNINDLHGHIQGDLALQIISKALQRISYKYNGFCCRYGGDEFVTFVSLPKDLSIDLFINEMNNQISSANQTTLPLHLSNGYVHCGANSRNINSLFEEADKMLYVEKNKDKNAKR